MAITLKTVKQLDRLTTVPNTVDVIVNDANGVTKRAQLSDILSLDNIPSAALERLVKVANQTARYALTTSDVQLGDSVLQLDTGIMYIVVDTTKLNSADGYQEYKAGTAAKAYSDESGNNIKASYASSMSRASNSRDILLKNKNGTTLSTVTLPTESDDINSLSTENTTPVDNDYLVAQTANGGTTTTTYKRKPFSALWTYISGKLGIASDTTKFLRNDGIWAVPISNPYSAGDGLSLSGTTFSIDRAPLYLECSTARSTAAKVVACTGFQLKTGSRIAVRFTNTGSSNPSSGNLTLNVNSTGAKTIVDGHTNKTVMTYSNAGYFYNNYVAEFVYDGTYWVWLNRDTNTTYGVVSKTANGLAPQLPNETTTTKYLRQDGTWVVPPNTTKGNGITTNAAKTGSGTTVTNTIAASTTMDNSIGTLLSNDVALNTNKAEKTAVANKADITSINITSGTTNNTGSTIASGTFFYYKGSLVKAKTDIANGATLTLNTNYEAVTAGGLNALNSALANIGKSNSWLPKFYYNNQTTPLSYTRENAWYAKIGNLVYLTARISISNVGSGFSLRISNTNDNLPYTPSGAASGSLVINGKSFGLSTNNTWTYLVASKGNNIYDADSSDLPTGAAVLTIIYPTND